MQIPIAKSLHEVVQLTPGTLHGALSCRENAKEWLTLYGEALYTQKFSQLLVKKKLTTVCRYLWFNTSKYTKTSHLSQRLYPNIRSWKLLEMLRTHKLTSHIYATGLVPQNVVCIGCKQPQIMYGHVFKCVKFNFAWNFAIEKTKEWLEKNQIIELISCNSEARIEITRQISQIIRYLKRKYGGEHMNKEENELFEKILSDVNSTENFKHIKKLGCGYNIQKQIDYIKHDQINIAKDYEERCKDKTRMANPHHLWIFDKMILKLSHLQDNEREMKYDIILPISNNEIEKVKSMILKKNEAFYAPDDFASQPQTITLFIFLAQYLNAILLQHGSIIENIKF